MTASDAGLSRPLLVFAGVHVLGQVILGLLSAVVSLGAIGTGANIGVLIAAAALAGTSFHARAGRLPEGGERVTFTLGATAISLALSLGAIWAVMAWYGVPMTGTNLSFVLAGKTGLLPVIAALAALIAAVCAWFGFALGAKSALNRAGRGR